jgi:hypothetical protein
MIKVFISVYNSIDTIEKCCLETFLNAELVGKARCLQTLIFLITQIINCFSECLTPKVQAKKDNLNE